MIIGAKLKTIQYLSITPLLPGHGTLIYKKYGRSPIEGEKLLFDPVWLVP